MDINKHEVEHHIITKGPLLHAHAQHVKQDKVEKAKSEFAKMEWLGIICHSNFPWAPLMDAGDHVGISMASTTLQWMTAIRYYTSMTSTLIAGKTMFSKINLLRGYHQIIPMAPSDVDKTVIIKSLKLLEFL